MDKKELICIGCPMGCSITVTMEKGNIVNIQGYTCPKGKAYAEKEVTNPTRIVTSIVKVSGGEREFTSVKTKEDIPKDQIFNVMREINQIQALAPIAIGDILLRDVAGTGVDIVATKAVPEK